MSAISEPRLLTSPTSTSQSTSRWSFITRDFPNTYVFWTLLLAITVLGAFLRFWRLDYQAYWTDEAHTINRFRGNYDYMVEQFIRQKQAFEPTWYVLLRYWRVVLNVTFHIRAEETYQPQYLRILPAIFGTATVPAACYLARQFMDRRGALLVTLLAAVNPFLIYYSRDIKMYAPLYCLVTLNMAVFLHWQNTRKHAALFPLFVLSGTAMLAVHALAGIVPALQLVFLLTRSRPKGWDVPLFILAAGIMSIFPYYWYHFVAINSGDRITDPNNTGLAWITSYTDMSPKTVAGIPTVHIFGYLWPVYPPATDPAAPTYKDWSYIDDWFFLGGADFTSHFAQRTWAWLAKGELYAAIGLFAVLLLGLIPWRRIPFRKRTPRPALSHALPANAATRGRWWWVFLWIAGPMFGMGLTWITPHDAYVEKVTECELTYDRAQTAVAFAEDDLQAATASADPLRQAAANAKLAEAQKALDQAGKTLADAQYQLKHNWYDFIFRGKTPKPLWEPRYLGFIIPAWLLWLAAALRRFPTWPLRATLITATVAICTFSSLSNHLMYRNTPFQIPATILEKYVDPQNRAATAVAIPWVKFPEPAMDVGSTIARHVIPASAEDNVLPWSRSRGSYRPWQFPPGLDTPQKFESWLRNYVVNNNQINQIVLTDRYGDITDPAQTLSDEGMKKLLGPRWELVYEENYEWHYEWRFYIFHTWRTRVWKLKPP